MDNNELWQPIPDYEELYEVSNKGVFKAKERFIRYVNPFNGKEKLALRKEKILKLVLRKDNGYNVVVLCKDGKPKTLYAHRLVYEAFNGTIPEGMQVNHINEDKTDNRLENLNLMTPKENANWGTRTKRGTEKLINGKRSYTVIQLTYPEGQFVKEWPSTMECSRNGFNHNIVGMCCRGERKQYKGYMWKYKN